MVARKHSKSAQSDNPTQDETPAMTAPKIDLSALAADVEESDERITRKSTRNKYANNPFTPHVLRSRETGKVMAITIPAHSVKEVINHLRAAAKEGRHGVKLQTVPAVYSGEEAVQVKFQAVEKKDTGNESAPCLVCRKQVSVTATGNFRTHGARNDRCAGSGEKV